MSDKLSACRLTPERQAEAYLTQNPMPIKESDIEKVAQLAHLELAPEELKIFGPQMAEIVNYVEQLNELDTANVVPAIGGFTPEGETTDSVRNDELAPPWARRQR